MKEIAFVKNCNSCNCLRAFLKCKKINSHLRIYLTGFSLMGGVTFYTFRDLLVSLGIKKIAVIGKCESCDSIKVECPYCGELHDLLEGKTEKCKRCAKSFYT